MSVFILIKFNHFFNAENVCQILSTEKELQKFASPLLGKMNNS